MEIVSEKVLQLNVYIFHKVSVKLVARLAKCIYISVHLLQIRKNKIRFSDTYKNLRIIIVTNLATASYNSSVACTDERKPFG
jgi:hypothetical protein